jgi:anion-transporting  ArsA/GET3 family ATPase
MLDAQSTFDDLVSRYATGPDQATTILANPVYQNISAALSGTQEYMAVEKLYELQESGAFDLIVVDTPPAQHALDFLEAPKHLARLLDNRVFRLLMTPTRAGLRALELGAQLMLRTIAKVAGGQVVADTIGFFTQFEGMEEGFRARARHRRRSPLPGYADVGVRGRGDNGRGQQVLPELRSLAERYGRRLGRDPAEPAGRQP